MANLSDFLVPTKGQRPTALNGPGSNGFWQRRAWLRAGSYRFVVKRTGRHRIAGLGGGSGARCSTGNGQVDSGSGGGCAIGEYDLVKGDVILVTVGLGSLGVAGLDAPADGGTTTITCAARGINIIIPGGKFTGANVRPTGGTLVNNIGGSAAFKPSTSAYRGGASSGTPYSDGFGSDSPAGSGWGGRSPTLFGSRTNFNGSGSADTSPAYIDEMTGIRSDDGTLRTFWDLEDIAGGARIRSSVDPGSGNGAGQTAFDNHANYLDSTAGIGGGGSCPASTGNSGNRFGGNGGNGGGGGHGDQTSTAKGGNGGDGLVLVHWDEVI